MKLRFNGSLLDPGVHPKLFMNLGDVLVELPVDGEVLIVGPWLGRQHLTEPAMAWRASHDDAD